MAHELFKYLFPLAYFDEINSRRGIGNDGGIIRDLKDRISCDGDIVSEDAPCNDFSGRVVSDERNIPLGVN